MIAEKQTTKRDRITFAADSGTTDTVVGTNVLQHIPTVEGEQLKQGKGYRAANGSIIPNLGEKRMCIRSKEGLKKKLVAQVCDVDRALLSASHCVRAGHKVVFDAGNNNSYIPDKKSMKKNYLHQEPGGMYTVEMDAEGF